MLANLSPLEKTSESLKKFGIQRNSSSINRRAKDAPNSVPILRPPVASQVRLLSFTNTGPPGV